MRRYFGRCIAVPLKREVAWRWAMDWLINSLCYKILCLTFPMAFLSSDGLSDFLQNCTAVFFITTIDDLNGQYEVSAKTLLQRLKRELFRDSDESEAVVTKTLNAVEEKPVGEKVNELEEEVRQLKALFKQLHPDL